MRLCLVLATTSVFMALAGIHLFWAAGGRAGREAALPRVGGAAAFDPSASATLVVAIALLAAAAVVAVAGGAIRLPLPAWIGRVAAAVLAAILTLRAIGDFRLVGFFKTRGGGRFAELDTFVYSPLCLLLAIAIVVILCTRKVAA